MSSYTSACHHHDNSQHPEGIILSIKAMLRRFGTDVCVCDHTVERKTFITGLSSNECFKEVGSALHCQ